jgi:hypothetical protein
MIDHQFLRLLSGAGGLAAVLLFVVLSYMPSLAPSLASSSSLALPVLSAGDDCNIKGNISVNTGERIYHVPGQEHYSETVISPSKGERWFCSEQEARAAGWRKSKI